MADADDPDETGFMGIAYTAIEEVPRVAELPREVVDGILVTDVMDDTPAQRAGITTGDILIGIENFLFDQSDGDAQEVFQSVLDQCQPGDSVRAIDALKGDRTIIMIAHRLTTVMNCDTLYLMNHCKIEDSGTYAELLERNPGFREMAGNN